jgi:hypothetical protein
MADPVIFKSILIAPCGMNCGTCVAHLRERNKCGGCRIPAEDKLVTRQKCIVKNCVSLKSTTSKFCYECETFPCKRIKQLDKRYRTKYRTSFIQNLETIREKGINTFLANETLKWTCPACGSVLTCHRNHCLVCQHEIKEASNL